ncbi:HD domain-containing phosphohydrolase [Alkalibacter mobilis]|uniref:HD domain-containing phosphohydrolase n=1 Tax=Alkalibacter mobilis TaxID=2787712 RepID=UPI00189FE40B|nr:HD domain-containing phosphohydrolase [Alkalibacter mobilis]MBF7097516.1 diguanylate cyclase [Alkalibacter mobilis]
MKDIFVETKDEIKDHSRFRALMDNSPSGIVIFDENGVFLEISKSASEITGIKKEDLIGKSFLDILTEIQADEFWQLISDLKKNSKSIEKINTLLLDQKEKIIESRFFKIGSNSLGEGFPVFGSVFNDVTERKQIEEDLYNEKEHFKTTLLSVGDGIITTDNKGRIIVMNPVAEMLTGWTITDAKGKNVGKIYKTKDGLTNNFCKNPAKDILETGRMTELSTDTYLISKTSRQIPIEHEAAPIKDSRGNITGCVLVFRDYTEKKEKQSQIEYLSFHDYLTGLYNRRYMEDAIKRLDTKRNLPFAVMILDINGLKLTNDAFGHETGDLLLKTVTSIIRESCRSDDIIGRMGGDEFLILFPNTNEQEVKSIQERINLRASETRVDSIIVSIASGYAVKTNKNQDMTNVQKEADNNMYANKIRNGKSMKVETVENVLKNVYDKYEVEELHTREVSRYCEKFARVMGMKKKEISDIKLAGLLHDLGKISVPREILNKETSITKEEHLQVERHPETSYQILKSVEEFAHLAEIVLYHHEKWDGSGYPEGLKENEIPLMSRMMAIADSYDAMISMRPYKTAKSKNEAVEELVKCAGSQFDPHLVEIFISNVL